LSDLFARLSGLLFSEETLQSALDLTVSLVREVLPGTAGAGVTLMKEGMRLTAAYSDEITNVADLLQYDLDEGPCLSAWREALPVRIDYMPEEQRWPRWAPAAAALGMRSSISVPITVRDNVPMGAIKAYSRHRNAYDDHDTKVLSMFAGQAAIVLANVQRYEDAQQLSDRLKGALRSRQLIAQAMGVVMQKEGLDEEGAFASLRKLAAGEYKTLQQVAGELVAEAAGRPAP
jgi:GAF domain-containing protein